MSFQLDKVMLHGEPKRQDSSAQVCDLDSPFPPVPDICPFLVARIDIKMVLFQYLAFVLNWSFSSVEHG